MKYIVLLIVAVIGGALGFLVPEIPYAYYDYTAVAILATLDSLFGGMTSILKGKFDLRIFISGYFGNAIIAILLVALRKSTQPLWRGWMELVIVSTTIAITLSFIAWTHNHLPIKDFRPYKIGNHLPTIMANSEPDQYEYTYICTKDSMEQAFTAENYPDSTWTLVRYESKLIQKGYESPIHDFEIINAYGDDLTWDILESEEPVTLVIMYDLAKADKSQMARHCIVTLHNPMPHLLIWYYTIQPYMTLHPSIILLSIFSLVLAPMR